MQGFKDILGSMRGAFCLLLVALCTVFYAVGQITSDQWLEFVKWASVTFVASKTVEIASGKMSGAPPPEGVRHADHP